MKSFFKKAGKGYSIVSCSAVALLLVVLIVANILVPIYKNAIDGYMQWNTGGEIITVGDPIVTVEKTWVAEDSFEVMRKIGEEGFVLLQNNDNTLPIQSDGTKINVFGIGSAQLLICGGGSGAIQDSFTGDSTGKTYTAIRVKESLENAGYTVNAELYQIFSDFDGKVTVETENGLEETSVHEMSIDNLKKQIDLDAVKEFSDIAVYTISRAGAEMADLSISELQLSAEELEMINYLDENFETLIVLINSSNAMELQVVCEKADAIIWVGNPGLVAMDALGRIMNGDVNPSGRMADTWAYSVTSAPAAINSGMTYSYSNVDTGFVPYSEGIFVGYLWYTTAAAENVINYDDVVMWSFGEGLSYTEFTWTAADEVKVSDDGTMSLEVTVTNVGAVSGKDVVELYLEAPYYNGGIEKAASKLLAFQKTTELAPGESETITLQWHKDDMASYDYINEKCYVLEAGEYKLKLQKSANPADKIAEVIYNIEQTVLYKDGEKRESDLVAATNLFDDTGNYESMKYLSRADAFANFDEVIIEGAGLAGTPLADKYVDQLSKTYGLAKDDSLPAYATGAEGDISLADLYGVDYDDPLWDDYLDQWTVEQMAELVGKGNYATAAIPEQGVPGTKDWDGPVGLHLTFGSGHYGGVAWPCATVVASTWNPDRAADFGEQIGREASYLGVMGWYGPGMNIHRSAICGRNFEYYSECGILSGKIAAAEVKAAKDHGVVTFIKHCALNEQEFGRMGSINWCNEQAIREIYLKPYEDSIKEGESVGVMSSYPRFGAEWAGATKALLTDVIRGEWGFEGCIITDAATGGYMTIEQGILAGGDLWLSFSTAHKKNAKAFVEEYGNVALYHLRRATKNTLYVIGNSDIAMDGFSAETYVSEEVSGSDIALTCVNVVFTLVIAVIVLLFVRRVRKPKIVVADADGNEVTS